MQIADVQVFNHAILYLHEHHPGLAARTGSSQSGSHLVKIIGEGGLTGRRAGG